MILLCTHQQKVHDQDWYAHSLHVAMCVCVYVTGPECCKRSAPQMEIPTHFQIDIQINTRDAYPVTTFSNTNYFRANARVAYKHTCIVYKQTHLHCLQTNTPKLFTEYLSLETLNIEAICPCWKDQERHHCDITFGSLQGATASMVHYVCVCVCVCVCV